MDMDLDRVDHLVGSPDEVRNCLTVDALIPKFTFAELEALNRGLITLGY